MIAIDRGMDNRLGVKSRIRKLALACGLRHDLPPWFWSQPKWRQNAYRLYFGYVQLSLLFLIVSNVVRLAQVGPSDIGIFTECIGSLLFLSFGMGKAHILYRNRHAIDEMLNRIHTVAENLKGNPIRNKEYMNVHNKRLKFLQLYSDAKLYGLLGAIALVTLQPYIPGMLNPRPDSRTPMHGWYPLDYSSRLSFTFACFSQWTQYSLIGARDMYADVTLVLIMATIHAQLVFMRQLLDDMIRKKQMGSLRYWIRQHQEIMRILDQFQSISAMVLFATYSNVALFFFFLLVRLTGDTNFEAFQQAVILAMTSSNMIHMYITSSIGDDIADSSVSVCEAIENEDLWEATKQEKMDLLQVAVRCNRPYYIVFGDNRKLCASSFGDIATAMFSYFNTVYQLRQ